MEIKLLFSELDLSVNVSFGSVNGAPQNDSKATSKGSFNLILADYLTDLKLHKQNKFRQKLHPQ